MQAVIHSLESMVLALAVTAFAHFGVVLKACDCPKVHVPAVRVSDPHAAAPRTIRRAPAPLARGLDRA